MFGRQVVQYGVGVGAKTLVNKLMIMGVLSLAAWGASAYFLHTVKENGALKFENGTLRGAAIRSEELRQQTVEDVDRISSRSAEIEGGFTEWEIDLRLLEDRVAAILPSGGICPKGCEYVPELVE